MISPKIVKLVAAALISPDTAFNSPPYRNERLLMEVAVSNPSLWVALDAKLRRESLEPIYRSASILCMRLFWLTHFIS